MKYLQGQCQPHLTETVKESVEGICLKIYHLSADHAKKIMEKSRDILRESGIQGMLYTSNWAIGKPVYQDNISDNFTILY